MSHSDKSTAKGRGSQLNPPHRVGGPQVDLEQIEDEEYLAHLLSRPTEYLADHSKSIVSENDSPDVGFRYSINPYRGCSHGCSYCYARPTHEFLGLNAGLDFETKIFVKHSAPELFREFLARKNWKPLLPLRSRADRTRMASALSCCAALVSISRLSPNKPARPARAFLRSRRSLRITGGVASVMVAEKGIKFSCYSTKLRRNLVT